MTLQGARRLHNLLAKILQQDSEPTAGKSTIPDAAKARLPKM